VATNAGLAYWGLAALLDFAVFFQNSIHRPPMAQIAAVIE
jgi:hypothetical protein